MFARSELVTPCNAGLVRPLLRIFCSVLIGICVGKHGLPIKYEQTPAAEAPTLCGEYALSPAFRYFNCGADVKRLVVHVRGIRLGDANHAGVIGEICLYTQKM